MMASLRSVLIRQAISLRFRKAIGRDCAVIEDVCGFLTIFTIFVIGRSRYSALVLALMGIAMLTR